MLPFHQAKEIKTSILAYLKATFTFHEQSVQEAFDQFLEDPENGIFKGPYISVRLPFVKATEEELDNIPLDIKPLWLPYDHQVKAWHRLSSRDKQPSPTLITTGTGSGKTESFLYPILDYCYKNNHRRGVKAILLYPMNALATDQAKRIAEIIEEHPLTKGKITAGLFIGEGKDNAKYPKSMGKDHIIENRESLLSSPPDILLTNFKMLDYSLMKGNFDDLWAFNKKDDSLLQFLVLDELHTYDGAQGTDVANLLRRLKMKLSIPAGYLCPVGTSATIGSAEEAAVLLSEYASKLFGEELTSESILTEQRLSLEEVFEDTAAMVDFLPSEEELKGAQPKASEGFEAYLERILHLWQQTKDGLDEGLLRLKIFKDLLQVLNSETNIISIERLIKKLQRINPSFNAIGEEYAEILIATLLALVAEVKSTDAKSGRRTPKFYSQVQLWIRELSGIWRSLEDTPRFVWKKDKVKGSLPPWFCRECGATGWVGVKYESKENLDRNLDEIVGKFINRDKNVYLLTQSQWFSVEDVKQQSYQPSESFRAYVEPLSLSLSSTEAFGPDLSAFLKHDSKGKMEHQCPECDSRNSLAIIGTRVATLNSVGVSQILASDMDKSGEQARKVLIFTNSVQDAAHQAGFVEARNYRFSLRSALQKVINQEKEAVALDVLADSFIRYWKKNSDERGSDPLDAYYLRFYPDDLKGRSKPRDYGQKGQYKAAFVKEFDARMRWEVYAEFGFKALIGRTLEKTASSGVYVRTNVLQKVFEGMDVWLQKQVPAQQLQEEAFIKFLYGIIYRLRTKGAIAHEFLDKFREQAFSQNTLRNLNWTKDDRHFLHPRYGLRTRIPKLLTHLREGKGVLESTYTQFTNWYHTYFKKCFNETSTHTDFINEFYQELLGQMTAVGLLDSIKTSENQHYALNANQFYIAKKVHTYECTKCEHKVYSADNEQLMEGMHCLYNRCLGIYRELPVQDEEDYYQRVYNRNRNPRIFAADHTGLLERRIRENLEIAFKNRPFFNSKNVLVATSTLEMGIDIGSLNVAINSATPPMPSNFLQRVGRAGRSSGAALIINFVKNQSHDLFYYQDPIEMMAGEIHTPGCYLEAKEILKRHFFAFCIDSWTSVNPSKNRIPTFIKYLRLESKDTSDRSLFIHSITEFIKSTKDNLVETFAKHYKNQIPEEVIENLKKELATEVYFNGYNSLFEGLKAEIESFKELMRSIKEEIVRRNLGENDDERKILEQESRNMFNLYKSLQMQHTLEYMTNVGCLPNYAFPETGVTLKARIYGERPQNSDVAAQSKDFTLVRSASQAIHELAPQNFFYSQGYRLEVSGTIVKDWSDSANFHEKRFCSRCDHIEIDTPKNEPHCPKCGDASWSSLTNKHFYAKMLQMYSSNKESDASISDISEQREQVQYILQKHFNTLKGITKGAYTIDSIPFGIQFIKQVHLTDVNVGVKQLTSANKLKMNNTTVFSQGFISCRNCGRCTSRVHETKDVSYFHYPYCKKRDQGYKGKNDETFKEVYFFREMQTEILKILVPTQEDSKDELLIFKAGIQLGLRKYFKGNPQHIQITEYKEYNEKTARYDNFIVLYDSIPGGTGYLEKISNTEVFTEILRLSYENIRNCSCQHQKKKGCYRCIYTYGNQFVQEDLDRAHAEKRFFSILKQVEGWEFQAEGLSAVSSSGKIEESELEDKFLRSLKSWCKRSEGLWHWDEFIDAGVRNYSLLYVNEGKEISYQIIPQVTLKNHSLRADFLLRCTAYKTSRNSESIHSEVPDIFIFMDGYEYHEESFQLDIQKRLGLHKEGYLTWTLSWEDMKRFDILFSETENQVDRSDTLDQKFRSSKHSNFYNNGLKAYKFSNKEWTLPYNSMERLLLVLREYPNKDPFIQGLQLYLFSFQENMFSPSFAPEDGEIALRTDEMRTYGLENKTGNVYVVPKLPSIGSDIRHRVTINIEQRKGLFTFTYEGKANFTKEEWNTFWLEYNLLQFFEYRSMEVSKDNTLESSQILEAIALEREDVKPFVLKMISKELVKNLEDLNALHLWQDGDAMAEAELIVHAKKVAYAPYSEECEEILRSNGFEIVSLEQLLAIKL